MGKSYKRENFDVSPDQEADIDCLQELIKAPTRKDAVLTAVRLALHLANEIQQGNKVFVGNGQEQGLRRLVILGLEPPDYWPWKYLVKRPHAWKKQLYIKGRKLPAAVVWNAMLTNKLSKEEAVDNWELPIEVIDEVLRYCEGNQALIQMEAAEEGLRLMHQGIKLEPDAPN